MRVIVFTAVLSEGSFPLLQGPVLGDDPHRRHRFNGLPGSSQHLNLHCLAETEGASIFLPPVILSGHARNAVLLDHFELTEFQRAPKSLCGFAEKSLFHLKAFFPRFSAIAAGLSRFPAFTPYSCLKTPYPSILLYQIGTLRFFPHLTHLYPLFSWCSCHWVCTTSARRRFCSSVSPSASST